MFCVGIDVSTGLDRRFGGWRPGGPIRRVGGGIGGRPRPRWEELLALLALAARREGQIRGTRSAAIRKLKGRVLCSPFHERR